MKLRTGLRTVRVGQCRTSVHADTPLELILESYFDEVPEPFRSVVPGGWIHGKLVTSAGTSGGIDRALDRVAKYRTQWSASHVQLWTGYDPQTPFGRLNYNDVGLRLRLRRLVGTFATPLLTPNPRRHPRQERGARSQR